MTELNDRLRHCIVSAFPTVTDTDVQTQNLDQLLSIDSLAAVTFIALIDEEFGVYLELEDLMELGNCRALQERLLGNSAPKMEETRN